MTMFHQLFQLALSATVTMTISADEKDGRMTINVVPKPKADLKEPALSTPLSLTATPEEFDAEFVQVLSTYRATRQSLAEQAEATNEVIDAAKQASARRGVDAVTKASTKNPRPPAKPPAPPAGDRDHDDVDTDGDGNDELVPDEPSGVQPAAAPAPVEPQLFG